LLPDFLQPVLRPSLYNRGVINLGWTGISLICAAKNPARAGIISTIN